MTRLAAGAVGALSIGLAALAAAAPDGTARSVADIYPGVDPQVTSDPQGFVRSGDLVLFNAADAEHGRELWRTDGTPEGTVLVADVQAGRAGGVVPTYQGVAALGDVAYFVADDGVHGAELWRSDGTRDGTWMVGDLDPGPAGSAPAGFAVVGATLYFVARDAAAGAELWRSDGTAAGTARVADVNPGPADANPSGVTAFGDLVVFTADDGVHGCELWASDGTAAGTRLVKDTNPSSSCYLRPNPGYPPFYDIFLGPGAFTPAGAVFFFTTDVGLWKSDGSEAGTELLHSFYGCSGFEEFRCPPTCMAAIDGVLYFQGDDTTAGAEPWRSDGTPEGTRRIADLLPTPCHFSSYDDCGSQACGFTADGDGVLFTARDSLAGYSQWTTDGTAAGTRKLGPPPPYGGPYPGAQPYPDPGVVLDGALIYGAGELYRHPGGSAAPVLLKDIMQRPAGSYPRWFVRAPASLLFFADDGRHGTELWRTDAGTGATALVADLWPGPDGGGSSYPTFVHPLAFAGGAAFVANDPDHLAGLWVSDGASAGTRRISGAAQVAQSQPAVAGDTLFFAGVDEAHGGELWRSDGSETGTRLVRDIVPGASWSQPLELTAVGEAVFFSALDGSGGRSLWRSDGSDAGTRRVGAAGEPGGLTRFGGGVAFFAPDYGNGGWWLWRSDGSDGGTAPIRDGFGPGEAPSGLTRAGATLFFAANERGVVGQRSELWRSDGSAAGTVPLLELAAGDAVTRYVGFSTLAVRDRLFFVVTEIPGGEALWTSDGTPAGTRPVRQLTTHVPAFWTRFLLAAGDVALLLVEDAHGSLRLWRSDGSEAGTAPVAGVPAALAIEPYTDAAVVDRALYVSADDARSGSELWAVPLGGLLADCRADCDGDFAVDVAELVRGVRIALGESALAACAAMDGDGDGAVSIAELIAAVGEALAGC